MDLQAHNLVGTPNSRWAKVTAFLCFALACGLLIGSLARAHPGGTPTVAPMTLAGID